jgi:predicted GNAT family acetyltransferase
METLLDRPIWNALTSRQAHFAVGDGPALRFDPEVGRFAATRDDAPDDVAALADLAPGKEPLIFIQARAPPDIPGTRVATRGVLAQMMAGPLSAPPEADFEIVPLGEADAAEMLALATLTEPGPFFARTHQLGDFFGVRVDGRLAAMAGERMKVPGFTEVSAVCTHPDHRGRGYGAALTHLAARRIEARGETAFLHVFPHNTGAISIYEALGFTLRREMTLTVTVRA